MNASPNTIKFSCPSCNQPLQIEAEAAGEMIDCPVCATPLQIPPTEPVALQRQAPSRVVQQSQPSPRTRSSLVSAPRKPKSIFPRVLIALIMLIVGGAAAFWFLGHPPAPSESAPPVVAAVKGPVAAMLAASSSASPSAVPSASSSAAPALSPALSAPVQRDHAVGPKQQAAAGGWNLSGNAKVNASQFGGSGSGDEEIIDMVARADGRLVMIGMLSSRDGIPPSKVQHVLVDKQEGAGYAFVAELSADGERFLWFSVFGADIINPTGLALGPDGSIAIGGGTLGRTAQVAGPDAGDFGKCKSVVLKVTADGSRVEWIRAGGPNQDAISDIAVDSKRRVVFLSGSFVRGGAAYVLRKNPDGSDSFFPGQPSGREWAIDFDVRGGLFTEEGQIGAYYAKGKSGDGFDYDGPGKWGPVRFKLLGIRQNGHVVLMPNDDIVVCGTLQYDFRVKGDKQFPAFDTIVARFREDGSLIWSSNLYQPNDSVHTPDQKDADMIYNPVNGDLYLLIGQHGSNVYRFKGNLYGDTGNLFIYWLGQVNAETGEVKEGWYWQNSRNTGYTDNGIPKSPPYPKLAGNSGAAIDVDSLGNIYMVGNAGARAFTTPNAWQPWPADQGGGGNAALTVLSPNLDRILYASMIKGPEQGKISANALVVTSQGVWVGGNSESALFPSQPKPWSAKTLSGESDAALTRFRFD